MCLARSPDNAARFLDSTFRLLVSSTGSVRLGSHSLPERSSQSSSSATLYLQSLGRGLQPRHLLLEQPQLTTQSGHLGPPRRLRPRLEPLLRRYRLVRSSLTLPQAAPCLSRQSYHLRGRPWGTLVGLPEVLHKVDVSMARRFRDPKFTGGAKSGVVTSFHG